MQEECKEDETELQLQSAVCQINTQKEINTASWMSESSPWQLEQLQIQQQHCIQSTHGRESSCVDHTASTAQYGTEDGDPEDVNTLDYFLAAFSGELSVIDFAKAAAKIQSDEPDDTGGPCDLACDMDDKVIRLISR
jgi:hypothetical protein